VAYAALGVDRVRTIVALLAAVSACPNQGRGVVRDDTLTIAQSLALPRSCHYAHERKTSHAGCRGFESRLPLHFLTFVLGTTPSW
jgi:hypothetical protein